MTVFKNEEVKEVAVVMEWLDGLVVVEVERVMIGIVCMSEERQVKRERGVGDVSDKRWQLLASICLLIAR